VGWIHVKHCREIAARAEGASRAGYNHASHIWIGAGVLGGLDQRAEQRRIQCIQY